MPKYPLEGVKITDLTLVWIGPYATKLLAQMGAEVIKVEPPDLDLTRTIGTPFSPGERPYNEAAYFNNYNRDKYDLALDLSKPQAIEIVKRLIARSDIFIENARPDVIEKIGLTYEVVRKIKPDIIMLSMPGFGRVGPEKYRLGYGPTVELMGGLVNSSGYEDGPPQRSGVSFGDPIGAVVTVGAIVSALHYRRRTGKGQYIILTQREAMICQLGEMMLDWQMNERTWPRMANRHPSMAPHSCYPCKDENTWVTIAVTTAEEWKRFCEAIGNPPWTAEERFSDELSRRKNQAELDKLIEEWTIQYTPYEVMNTLQHAGVAAGPVLSCKGLFEDPHMRARNFYELVTHPEAGTHFYDGFPWKLSETPGYTRRPAPLFGEHNEYVLGEILGMSKEEIARLAEEKVTCTTPLQEDVAT